MPNTISVGELRQHPTPMLRAVRAGWTYTITDHGEPVTEIAAHHAARWVSAAEVDALLREMGADAAWAREIAEDRACAAVRSIS